MSLRENNCKATSPFFALGRQEHREQRLLHHTCPWLSDWRTASFASLILLCVRGLLQQKTVSEMSNRRVISWHFLDIWCNWATQFRHWKLHSCISNNALPRLSSPNAMATLRLIQHELEWWERPRRWLLLQDPNLPCFLIKCCCYCFLGLSPWAGKSHFHSNAIFQCCWSVLTSTQQGKHSWSWQLSQAKKSAGVQPCRQSCSKT